MLGDAVKGVPADVTVELPFVTVTVSKDVDVTSATIVRLNSLTLRAHIVSSYILS